MLPTLILASQSPARRQLLTAAGFSFAVEPSDFDEDSVYHSDPQQLVQVLAVKKAETVAARQTEPAIILGADSLFVFDGNVYGKPRDAAESLHRLKLMQGQMGLLYTGHAAISTDRGRQLSSVGITKVYFGSMTDTEIRSYIASGEPLACAGSFALDGYGGLFIERIDGCHSNVIGISLPIVRALIAGLGYSVMDFWQPQS